VKRAIAIILALCACIVPAYAQSSPPAAVAAPIGACPVGIVAILPVNSRNPRGATASEFSAFLWSPSGVRSASGSLWVNASGKPYNVPFVNRAVLSDVMQGAIDPITFRLPKEAALENVFIDTYGDAQPVACAIDDVWTPSFSHRLSDDLFKSFSTVTPADPIDARPITDLAAACRAADAPARTLHNEPPRRPPAIVSRMAANVSVFVDLNADSSIRFARLLRPGNSYLDDIALDTARLSVFRTEVQHCRPVATTVVFVVRFGE